MKRIGRSIGWLMLALALAVSGARANGRLGTVAFSDGHILSGSLSLSPGKDLRVFTDASAVSVPLAEVKEIRFQVEKEEMLTGFYFPNAGQATQVKTDDVYPVRYFSVVITLKDGKPVAGHLMTTSLYAERDGGVRKIVLMAKMSGQDGQKLSDLIYPAAIRFDQNAPGVAGAEVDLVGTDFAGIRTPVIFARPDLALLPASPVEGKQAWTVPTDHPERILFSVEAGNGIHVAWPSPDPAFDLTIQPVLKVALAEMHDFFDTRAVLGCSREDDDVYSLVMLSRAGPTDSFNAGRIPWSLVAMRWKYDTDQGKLTLLNRISLATGRAEDNAKLPEVWKQPELLRDVSAMDTP